MRLEGLVIPVSFDTGLLAKGLDIVTDALKEVIKQTLEYAASVRDLSLISGESAEETSRFIQVLDDYQLSAEDALTATRALTKEGYAPTTETLALLSDEYLSINDAQARNEFILKNLGRAGTDWVRVLTQGGTAIRDQSRAVSESLILGDKQLAQAQKLVEAQDNLEDAVQGLTLTVGTKAIPVLTFYLSTWLDISRGLTEGKWGIDNTARAMDDLLRSIGVLPPALEETKAAMDDTWISAEALEEQMKALADANLSMFNAILTVQAELDSFSASNKDLQDQQADLLNQMEELRVQGVEEMSAEMVNLQREYANTGEAIVELAVQHEQAMKRIVFSLLMARLEADGLTASEYNIALAAGEALGVIDHDTAEMALRFDALAAKLAESNAYIASSAAGMFDAALSGEVYSAYEVLHPPGYQFSNNPNLGGNPGYASGGNPSGLSWVGERGPELLNLPGGSHVYSNQQSQAMQPAIDYYKLASILAAEVAKVAA